jgi:ABC-2 type transport system permease protein
MAARHNSDSFFRANYLTIVSAYALMLLGEVCFWNCFGLDRSAVQAYFTMPVPLTMVFWAKNIAAVFFILLELSMVSLFCLLLRMPVNLTRIGEAFGVTLVFATFLLAFGNILSVRYPKPINPGQSWRSGAVARAQAFLLFLYPLAAAPIALAYGAQFAFDSQLAFYSVLLLDFFIGLTVYSIALESAVHVAENTKESIVVALTQAEGPTGT